MLIAIAENSGCTQAELARGLHLQPANVVPVVRKLVSEGLIDRDRGDGRAVALLTSDGKITLSRARDALQRQEDMIAQVLPGMERDEVLRILRGDRQVGPEVSAATLVSGQATLHLVLAGQKAGCHVRWRHGNKIRVEKGAQ